MTDPIEFEHVGKAFRTRTVLDDLSFSVPEGAVVGLLGPNGAGKSTAMRVLLGLYKPTTGTSRILGHSPGSPGFRAAVRKVGAIIESPPLYKNVSPVANLAIRVAATGLSVNDARVRDVINQVGLAERADDKTGDFSLGMRQRMGIALALVGSPSVVVLDEPTNGLDPAGTVEIRNLVKRLPAQGATVLICTHRLQEIELTCDYVVVLQKGRLVTKGTLDEVRAMGSSSSGHRIELAPDQVGTAADLLARLELGEVSVDGNVVRTTRTADDPAVVTRALVEHGIYLRGLETSQATLEDAFLEITGGVDARAS